MLPVIDTMCEGDIERVARLRFDAFFQNSARTLEEDAAAFAGLWLMTATWRPHSSPALAAHQSDPSSWSTASWNRRMI